MKLVVTILIFAIYASGISAQEKYYQSTKTYHENGYTYQCDVAESRIATLYNKENKLTNVDQINKITGDFPNSLSRKKNQLEVETWTKPKCFSIVNNAFSAAEKQRVKGSEFTITMYIDSDSGKVSEVNFRFSIIRPYATIPVSVYRKIEVELKKNIWFTPTEEGKKINYLVLWWRQEPE